jgi:small subunit ribosomal protein S3Ae
MAKVVVKSKIKKVKKKFPVKFIAPKFLNSKILGESLVTDLKAVIGKIITMNMMYVSGSIKNQNIRLKFNVENVDSGNAKTQICGYEHISYFLKRNIKKGTNLIDHRILAKLKTNEVLIIKPIIVTKSKISGLTKKNIRAELLRLIETSLKEIEFEDFFSQVLDGRIQLKIKNDLKKISPIKTLEFKKIIVKK